MRSAFNSLQLGLMLAAAFFQGCQSDELVPLEPFAVNRPAYVTAAANFCLQPGNVYRQRLKYIFVIDKSSSNQNLPDATDPAGMRRYAPLSSFLQDSLDDPGYTYYSMVRFATTSTVAQNFTDNRLAFKTAVDAEWNRNGFRQPADLGYTDYLSALDSVQKLITADASASQASAEGPPLSSVYVVVFISDGAPIVPFAGNADGVITQAPSAILAKISTLRGLKSDPKLKGAIDDVVLHTGYYFELPDADAQTLLADMAAQGSGSAYTFGAGAIIDFTLFAVPVRKVRHIFSDLLIENRSATWWDDGRFLRDFDGDGVPDEVEKALGSNVEKADSDGNGVSDLVELRIKGRPCKDSGCSSQLAVRDNYAICTGLLSQAENSGGDLSVLDTDSDGLNDCEELVLVSLPDRFDSNGDGIPDFLSLKNRLPYIAGANLSSADADSDGLSNSREIKFGSPLFSANGRLVNFKPMTYDLSRVPSPGASDCYQASIGDISVLGSDNLLRIYLLENTAVVDDKKILRVAEGRLEGFSEAIRFIDGDFKWKETGGL